MEFKSIDDMNLTVRQREQHFFNKGYEYALLHFEMAVKELKIAKGLEKKIRSEYLNFLNTDSQTKRC